MAGVESFIAVSDLLLVLVGPPPISEGGHTFVHELQEFLVGYLEVVSLHESLVDLLPDEFATHVLTQPGMVLLEERTAPGLSFDDAEVLQFGVGFGYGVAVDPQFLRKGSDRGKSLARLKGTRGCRGLDLVDELEVDRFPRLVIQLKDHCCDLLS